MKKWEFQCPKEAFIEIIRDFQDKSIYLYEDEIEEFVEDFLKRHFQDYIPRED